MSARPIDWTMPLRTTDGHDMATVERINPSLPRPISIAVRATGWRGDVDREGRLKPDHCPVVENVPPEPVIVERFGLVHQPEEGRYVASSGYGLSKSRDEIEKIAREERHYRVARVLIEETGA